MRRFLFPVFVWLPVFATIADVRGDIVLSNLGSPVNEFTQVAEANIPGFGHLGTDIAFPFTAGELAKLDRVSIWHLNIPQPFGEGFSVTIATDSAGLPGSSLMSFTGDTSPIENGIYEYDAAADLVLSPNTSYWIVLSVPHGLSAPESSFTLASTNNSTVVSDPGWTMGNEYASQAYLDGQVFSPWSTTASSGYSGLFAISATPIPEPGTLWLLGMSAGLLAKKRTS